MLELTRQNYLQEVENAAIPVLIEFSTVPMISKEFAQSYRHKCKFCRVDVATQASFARRFDLLRLPTSILLQKGRIVQRISGAHTDEEWRKILDLD